MMTEKGAAKKGKITARQSMTISENTTFQKPESVIYNIAVDPHNHTVMQIRLNIKLALTLKVIRCVRNAEEPMALSILVPMLG